MYVQYEINTKSSELEQLKPFSEWARANMALEQIE